MLPAGIQSIEWHCAIIHRRLGCACSDFTRPVLTTLGGSSSARATTTINQIRRPFISVAGPTAWNRLPVNIKLSPSVDVFKAQLKTFLFAKSYEHK